MAYDQELEGHEATAVLAAERVAVGWSVFDHAFWYELEAVDETVKSRDIRQLQGIDNLYLFMSRTVGVVDWAASHGVIQKLACESGTKQSDIDVARTLAAALG